MADLPDEPTRPFPTPIPGLAPDEQAEQMARRLAEEPVPAADPYDLARRLRGLADVPRVTAESAAPLEVGARETFWATNVDTDEHFQFTARLVYATDHVYFFAEEGVSAEESEARDLSEEFETRIYPTNRAFFGSEWTPGVDGDAHLYIVYATNLGDSIAGYFGSNDSLTPAVHPYSNAHEMFFLNADVQGLGDEYALSTLAHEFEHMIQWNQDRNENGWLDEGFAEVAAFINGYDVGGADTLFAYDTDLPLTYWPPDVDAAHYGQSFMLVAYFLDRFGPEATRALVASQANGLDSIDAVLAGLGEVDPMSGQSLTTEDVVRDWAVAMVLQDSSVAGGRYAYASYPRAPQASPQVSLSRCPSGEVPGEVNQYGFETIDIDCRGEFTLTFQGDTLARIVPAEAHGGDHMVWSNRGDQSDMTLTRSFDLRGLSGPIEFSYWTWFDIEEGWDYAYLTASQDQGTTWQVLETPSGTEWDPYGNSFGPGYTGLSGGGSASQWIREAVDLSQYAGRQVMLRFEYITDAAVNGEGILLDDLALPALGYQEGFEEGDGGWEAHGFIRLYNRLPQAYRVVLAVRRDDWQIEELTLDTDRRAEVPLRLDDEVREAALIILGTTRSTWQPAPYLVEIRRP
jgi:hypothetical protein